MNEQQFNSRMGEQDVVSLLDLLAVENVTPWVDGGWGIDALVGRQTREHSDLDLVIEKRHEPSTILTLKAEGFDEVPMWFTTLTHTVWRHEDGRAVDLHIVVLDGDGAGVYGDEGTYPAEGLAGRGRIGGRDVRCISATIQAEFHYGYELRDRDRHDLALLNAELGVTLPPEYR